MNNFKVVIWTCHKKFIKFNFKVKCFNSLVMNYSNNVNFALKVSQFGKLNLMTTVINIHNFSFMFMTGVIQINMMLKKL